MTVDALAGYTVVELSTGVAGAYAAKMFADAGAEVIVVEPAAGCELRRSTRRGRLGEDAPDSPLFRWLAAGKRCVAGDLDDPGVRALADAAHVVCRSSRRHRRTGRSAAADRVRALRQGVAP